VENEDKGRLIERSGTQFDPSLSYTFMEMRARSRRWFAAKTLSALSCDLKLAAVVPRGTEFVK